MPPSLVERLTEELEAEIVERQAMPPERRVVLMRTLAGLADERSKLLQPLRERDPDRSPEDPSRTASAWPTAGQDRKLDAPENDLDGWQDARTTICLAGNCHSAP